METKYYTITLTEKQRHMALKALTSHYFNVEDDLTSVRVLGEIQQKLQGEWLRQRGWPVGNEEETDGS